MCIGFRLKTKKTQNKQEAIINKVNISGYSSPAKNNKDENDFAVEMGDDQARDLMVLVEKAIDEWARLHKLEYLPKHIVYRQALSMMNAWGDIMKNNLP